MQSSIMMLVSPPEMRGQMMGLLSFCIGVANLLGALEISFVVSVLSLQNTHFAARHDCPGPTVPGDGPHTPDQAAPVAG